MANFYDLLDKHSNSNRIACLETASVLQHAASRQNVTRVQFITVDKNDIVDTDEVVTYYINDKFKDLLGTELEYINGTLCTTIIRTLFDCIRFSKHDEDLEELIIRSFNLFDKDDIIAFLEERECKEQFDSILEELCFDGYDSIAQ